MSLHQINIYGMDFVEVAIERLKAFEPEEGYYLAFSGGKDSVVIKELANIAGVKYDAHYTNWQTGRRRKLSWNGTPEAG